MSVFLQRISTVYHVLPVITSIATVPLRLV